MTSMEDSLTITNERFDEINSFINKLYTTEPLSGIIVQLAMRSDLKDIERVYAGFLFGIRYSNDIVYNNFCKRVSKDMLR